MTWKPIYPRRIPARKPEGHKPRAPRWSAGYEQPFMSITCDYIAIQVSSDDDPELEKFFNLAKHDETTAADSPEVVEILRCVTGDGAIDYVRLAYWTDPASHTRWLSSSPLGQWFKNLDPRFVEFGAWHEVVQAPLEHLQTIFSSPNRRFGFAQAPGITMESITTNGYFGAARDRLPVSAIHMLEAPTPHRRRKNVPSLGNRVRAVVGENTVVIRSGQYWQEAEGEQLDDYEENLEAKLLRGMSHLSDNPEETGTMSLRILRNLGTDRQPLRETSTLAFFRSLTELESWAESHPTHTAIYEHAIEKNRQYGEERSVTTWHEMFVLPETSTFEYVNCHPATGLLAFAPQLWNVIEPESVMS